LTVVSVRIKTMKRNFIIEIDPSFALDTNIYRHFAHSTSGIAPKGPCWFSLEMIV
jgi:hypothetical protein